LWLLASYGLNVYGTLLVATIPGVRALVAA
jgi:hypothetical protein